MQPSGAESHRLIRASLAIEAAYHGAVVRPLYQRRASPQLGPPRQVVVLDVVVPHRDACSIRSD